MMSNSCRTLVLGTAYGYEVRNIWVFVESLRRYYTGEVALLVSSRSSRTLYQYLAAKGITPVFFDCAAWMFSHVQFSRFVRYGDFLRRSDIYDRVLLTDVSDVIFQGNPFDGAPDGDLLCFMEARGRSIAMCPANSNWVTALYGPQMLARIGSRDISCSGTTIGTHAAVLDYIDRLVSHVSPARFVPLFGKRGGHDQGIHNVLLHTGALPRARAVPNGIHVFTVGFVPDAEIVLDGGRILTATGNCCPIVHQYNYKPALYGHVAAQYPLPPEFGIF
jgi:hypothetical protein